MNLKNLRKIIMVLVLVFSFAACGSSGESENADFAGSADDIVLEAIDYSEYVTLGQYSGMDIEVSEIYEVTDEDVQAQIDAILEANAEEEQITEGVTAEGDTVNLDFTGYMDGEAFDGGSSTGYEYEIGSLGFIEDLDSQLAGLTVGETYDLNCTFPDDYGNEDYAGQDVVFKVTVNYIIESILPEWNDEFVENYTSGEYTTAGDLEAYIREYLESSAEAEQLSSYSEGIWSAIIENSEFSGLPEDQVEESSAYYYEALISYYSTYADLFGMELEELLELYGTSDEEIVEYTQYLAESEVRLFLLANMICLAENLELSEEDYAAQMTEEAEYYGYDSYEALVELSGAEYLMNTYKYSIASEWLEKNNNMVVAES